MIWLYQNSGRNIFLANSWDFDKFFWMVVFKVFTTCKTILLILPQFNITLMSFLLSYNIWTCFYLLYVTEESEIVARKSSIKNVFLKIPQNSQENIWAEVSFAVKLQNFIKYRIWYRCFPANFAKPLRTSISQTSVKTCLWKVRSLLEFLSVKF